MRTILVEMLYSWSGRWHADLHRLMAKDDGKSLDDCLVKDGPHETRLAVDIVGLKDVAVTFDEEKDGNDYVMRAENNTVGK